MFPTQEAFQRALRIAKYWMSHKQHKMLAVHLRATDRTMTVTEMANAMGYDTYHAVNIHYGSLASKIAKRMRWPVPLGEPELITLVTLDRGGPEAHWKLTMRPELANALVSLKWR